MPHVLVGQEWFLSVLLEHGDPTSTPGCVLGGEKKGAGGVRIIKAEPQFSFRELCVGKRVEAGCREEFGLGEGVCRWGGEVRTGHLHSVQVQSLSPAHPFSPASGWGYHGSPWA